MCMRDKNQEERTTSACETKTKKTQNETKTKPEELIGSDRGEMRLDQTNQKRDQFLRWCKGHSMYDCHYC